MLRKVENMQGHDLEKAYQKAERLMLMMLAASALVMIKNHWTIVDVRGSILCRVITRYEFAETARVNNKLRLHKTKTAVSAPVCITNCCKSLQ